MTAKEYLMSLRRLDVMIDQKIQEIKDLQEMSTSVGSFDYSKDRVQTSPSGDAPYVRTVEKISDMVVDVTKSIDQLAELKNKIIDQIHGLSDQRYIQVLYLRYVRYESYEKIAVDLHYSYDHVKHLHVKALRDFERRYSQFLKDSTL